MSGTLKIRVVLITLCGALLTPSCTSSDIPAATTAPARRTAGASDPTESARVVQRAILQDRPELLRQLIGDEGVAALGFASGASYRGDNNADEIVSAFADALEGSEPACVGFVPDAGSLPDKAILVYRDLPIDWSRFGLDARSSAGMTIQLFNLEERWQFVYITPFAFETDLPIIGPLQDCPEG